MPSAPMVGATGTLADRSSCPGAVVSLGRDLEQLQLTYRV